MSDFELGARFLGNGRCSFCVWAPFIDVVALHVLPPREVVVPLERDDKGYHRGVVDGLAPGDRYFYLLNGGMERPDPASRYQPEGVHRASEIVDPDFPWTDASWFGLPLQDYIIYELHVGTYTPEGDFEALIPYLDEWKNLGVTAVELMPVAQFPGDRNWGYDGVHPFAVQNTYGGPISLKKMVNACHEKELAVILDVVYNHLGPEGNYLSQFGPYFTDRYRTPWGDAINFDGPFSDEVRRFFIENALYWFRNFHIDALRIDAVHAIYDFSAKPFLQQLTKAVREEERRCTRRMHVFAESPLNDVRVLHPPDQGGYGLDAQWNDDFHHALHTLLTGERSGYYKDFGSFNHFFKAFREGFVYSGQYSPYYRRSHGTSSATIPAHRFVVFSQNHDHIGNRMLGERLSTLVTMEQLKLAAAAVILSPYIPLIFMGEEYGETAPFVYFISHLDQDLVEAVRQGRRKEFAEFLSMWEPLAPQDGATFARAKLNHDLKYISPHKFLLKYYKVLIALRKKLPPLARLSKDDMEMSRDEKTRALFIRRWAEKDEAVTVLHLHDASASLEIPLPAGTWYKLLDSAESCWQGPGSSIPEITESNGYTTMDIPPWSCVVFHRKND